MGMLDVLRDVFIVLKLDGVISHTTWVCLKAAELPQNPTTIDQKALSKKLVKFGNAVFQLCKWTDGQAYSPQTILQKSQ